LAIRKFRDRTMQAIRSQMLINGSNPKPSTQIDFLIKAGYLGWSGFGTTYGM